MKGNRSRVFFLGGNDLEMEAIRDLLHGRAQVRDRHLAGDARVSEYDGEGDVLLWAIKDHDRLVLVELEDDLDYGRCFMEVTTIRSPRAGAEGPSRLEQVFALLELPPSAWTRWHELVLAYGRASIAGLLEVGATLEEIARILAVDRVAREDVTAQVAEAVAAAERRMDGGLVLVRLPQDRTATVEHRLRRALGVPDFDTLVIVSPWEVFVASRRQVATSLAARFGGEVRHGEPYEPCSWRSATVSWPDVVAAVEEVLGG